MNINKIFNNHNLIYFYVIFTLLFPTLIVNKIVFALIFILFIGLINKYKFPTISPVYVILIFSYGMLLSFFNLVDRSLSNQFFVSTFSLIIIYPIIKNKIDFDKVVKFSGLILAIYSLISFIIVVIFIDSSISEQYYFFFSKYSAGSNGLREFAEEGLISFHAGTAPFLYLTLVLYFESFLDRKNIFLFFVIILHIFVIFISGSRGTFFSSLLAVIILLIFKSGYRLKIALLTLSIPVLILFISYIYQYTEIFSSNEDSNNVKLGHYQSFIESSNFFNLIIGNGLGAIYFTKGSGFYKAHTEITPIDMIRYFGIVLAFVLYWVILFPTNYIKTYFGKNFLYVIIFMIYILNSMTNPTMFNSYGLLVVIWYWYKLLTSEVNLYKCNSQPFLS